VVVRLRPYFLVVRVTREKYKQTVERRCKLQTCLLIDVADFRAFFLTFRKDVPSYPQGYASLHIPENEDGTPLRSFGNKLPNQTAQQSRRSGSSTVKRRKPQSAVRLLLRVYLCLIILSSSFVVSSSCVIRFMDE